MTPGGQHFWAAPFEIDAEFGGKGVDLRGGFAQTKLPLKSDAANPSANTTIAIVATDAALSKAQAKRVAVAAQDGIGRAIVPAHTPMDGDLVFAVSTARRHMTDPLSEVMEIGHAASLCLSRAIARAVYEANR